MLNVLEATAALTVANWLADSPTQGVRPTSDELVEAVSILASSATHRLNLPFQSVPIDAIVARVTADDLADEDRRRVCTAWLVDEGRYMRTRWGAERVPKGYIGVWCEACEWTVKIPAKLGRDHADGVRRSHIGTAHGSMVAGGAMVYGPELVG